MSFAMMHIVPVDDERPHDETDDCWCEPSIEHSGRSKIVTHNAADMREEYERATGEALPGKPWLCVKDSVPMGFDYP